ncbi:MAG: regulatory iron-sulfur-containing complex subunit RicT, partial [bacterium]
NNIENTVPLPTVESPAPPSPPSQELPGVVCPFIGVEFKGNRRLCFSNPLEFPFHLGDWAVVRVEKGEDMGKAVHLLERLPADFPAPTFEVLRRATARDQNLMKEYHQREEEAKQICREKIAKHNLVMKLVDVEYQFDGRKLTFYFTAEGRVDFRQLVKDLAATFRTRIELRQIGARDETKRFSGIGPCGRILCCASFLTDFCPISTQMAKDQNLPLNPSKISGCCGRLKCCLKYELDVYREALQFLPPCEARLETVRGPAQIEKLDVYNDLIFLRFQSGELEKIEAAALETLLTPGTIPMTAPEKAEVRESTESEVIPDDESAECRSANTPTSASHTEFKSKPKKIQKKTKIQQSKAQLRYRKRMNYPETKKRSDRRDQSKNKPK